jgi:hypothetical protein
VVKDYSGFTARINWDFFIPFNPLFDLGVKMTKKKELTKLCAVHTKRDR